MRLEQVSPFPLERYRQPTNVKTEGPSSDDDTQVLVRTTPGVEYVKASPSYGIARVVGWRVPAGLLCWLFFRFGCDRCRYYESAGCVGLVTRDGLTTVLQNPAGELAITRFL